jgi:hypothetical protein
VNALSFAVVLQKLQCGLVTSARVSIGNTLQLQITCTVFNEARRAIINNCSLDTLGAATNLERGATTEAANVASEEWT